MCADKKQTWEKLNRDPVCGGGLSALSLTNRDKLGGFRMTVSGFLIITLSCLKHKNKDRDRNKIVFIVYIYISV